jgi:hypothetical protein
MHMLILVERDPTSYGSWQSLIQKKKFPDLSVQEVVSKYQKEKKLLCVLDGHFLSGRKILIRIFYSSPSSALIFSKNLSANSRFSAPPFCR